MTVKIQPLPPEVINLIAAGEVIDSPAAAVRELVENSLDAGATRIVISIVPEKWQVQVADNGRGMNLANLQQAALAHSTSKISHLKDLSQITSLGFRGEALHSIAHVSELEIFSRPNTGMPLADSEGWRVVYNQEGEAIEEETVAIAPGTVVKVSNLFGRWPLRRQGIPSAAQQLRRVQLLVQQVALCHPEVTWQVRQDNKPWLQISRSSTAKKILPQLVRGVRFSDLEEVRMEIGGESPTSPKGKQSLELVLGLPDRCHRGRADWVKVGINGRTIRSPELEQTIISALARTCPRDRYPICFIHLRISPHQIDWNRHPAKTEIYLHDLSYWQEQIKGAIDKALELGAETMPESPLPERVEKLLKASEKKGVYNTRKSDGGDGGNSGDRDLGLIELKAIAQLHQTYIVAEHPNGIWLIEQHIAHERILYEQLCDAWQLVSLETPIILSNLSLAQLEQLERLELEVDSFGEQLWAARNAPLILAKRDDCSDALIELSKGGDLEAAKVATACRSAIRNGTPLTVPEMQDILEQWQITRHPRTCPHGRPIFLKLEESSLARFFRRHWVIGKSHGI
ncbi:MAG: DNA mismatch repair endonuclease MutL [Cyanobacteriota bacterium]|nr:DNA mismatch repair endonuclease MutL [Cyanobacteriota bacterium]